MNSVTNFLLGAEFVPHAVCLLWRPDLLALHGGSDFLVAVAYFTIPVLILKATQDRPDLIDRQVAILFAVFILACGLSHLAGLITLWLPFYGLQGIIKFATALVSIYTAYMLVKLLPQFLTLPSREELARKEADLLIEAREREAIQAENRRLADFAFIAAHDLRAPLRGINGITQMLSEDLPAEVARSPEIAEQLRLLDQQSNRMGQLVADLLDYARVGSEADVGEPLDLQGTVTEIASLLSLPPDVTVKVEGTLPTVDLIKPKIEIILRNLIGNAVQHHDRGNATITIRGLGWREGQFHMEIEDDGPGIPSDSREKIFKAFERLDARNEGTGLGLAAVKRAVTSHAGSIAVRNGADGRGAIFTVQLGQPWKQPAPA